MSDTNGFVDSLSDIRPSETKVTQRRIGILREEVRRFRDSRGQLPLHLFEILALPESDPTLKPQERWLKDGWGRAFQYTVAKGGVTYELRSAGPDGRVGTGDDLVAGDR